MRRVVDLSKYHGKRVKIVRPRSSIEGRVDGGPYCKKHSKETVLSDETVTVAMGCHCAPDTVLVMYGKNKSLEMSLEDAGLPPIHTK